MNDRFLNCYCTPILWRDSLTLKAFFSKSTFQWFVMTSSMKHLENAMSDSKRFAPTLNWKNCHLGNAKSLFWTFDPTRPFQCVESQNGHFCDHSLNLQNFLKGWVFYCGNIWYTLYLYVKCIVLANWLTNVSHLSSSWRWRAVIPKYRYTDSPILSPQMLFDRILPLKNKKS